MKNQIRNKLKKIIQLDTRRLISEEKIQKNLLSLLSKYNTIGLYSSIKKELNLDKVFNELVKTKEIYFPIVVDEIDFRKVEDLDELQNGFYNIKEPVNGKSIDLNKINAIVLPCVGVNKKGYRLGRGKGYYDRALKNYQGVKIVTIFNYQLVEEDFQEAHDVRIDYIVMEDKIYHVGDINV